MSREQLSVTDRAYLHGILAGMMYQGGPFIKGFICGQISIRVPKSEQDARRYDQLLAEYSKDEDLK